MYKKQRTILGLSLISCLVLHFFSYSPYGMYPHYLSVFSSFFVFLTLYPLLLYKKTLNIYITPLIVLNWIYFQSPFLLQEKTKYFPRVILDEYIPEIALYTCISIPLIYIGYFYFFKHVKPISPKNFTFSNNNLRKMTLFFVGLSITHRLGLSFAPGITNSLSNIIQLLFYSPTIAFALYGLYLMRTKSRPKFTFFHIFTITYLFSELLIRVSTTMFVSTALLFSGVFLVYFYEKRKVPITYLLILSFFLIPFYFARKYFRAISESTTIEATSNIERGQLFLEKIYTEEGQESTERYSTKVARRKLYQKNRFENLSFISQVVYHHKKRDRPFMNGESFYWLPLVPIPRIIYPNKPKNLMATEVASSYGLRGKGSTAAINFPMLVEGYANFGFLGMIGLAFCFGLAFKWIVMKFGVGYGDINILIIINCIKQFIHAEGNITLVFGALIQVFIFWWLLLFLFRLNNKPVQV